MRSTDNRQRESLEPQPNLGDYLTNKNVAILLALAVVIVAFARGDIDVIATLNYLAGLGAQ